ncbi:RDD family protein [Microbacterium sp. SA39]|uniref:RDD family protein n=1 Tax=Microbacterium sp. SA39 TaxID=1263625 RepID=UPI0005FA7B02|nr:RDD family protein [Microbacterium sp. SA39]KJQ53305.1 RDD family protein [Microbacterium sp. SA39]
MIWEIDEQKQTIEGLDAQGRPDPAYAAALGLLRAPFGRRALAAMIDGGIWVLLQLPLWIGALPLVLKLASGSISSYGFINHPDFVFSVVMASVSTLLSLIFLIVQLLLHGLKGRTIGKGLTGLRSVDVRTLERPRVGAVLLRFLIVVAAGIVPVLGPAVILASPTFDPEGRGRGLHDKATKIWLVDVRNGLNPYDEKRMRVARKVVKAEPTPERSALPSLATPVDPGAQPQYRPGSRVSAGVLGVARPYEAHERPTVGLPTVAPVVDLSTGESGKPVLGGYRIPDGERTAGTDRSVAAAPTAAPVAAQPATAAPAPQPTAVPAPQPTAVPVAQPAPPASDPASVPAPAPVSVPEPVAPPAPEPAVRFGLRFDTGESILITEPVVLGRNPDAAEHPGARAIALVDDSRSLSKTHMLVRPVEGGLEVIDCRSTNGSGLIRGGTEYGIAAGTPVQTVDGDRIRLGDRVAAVVRA